LETVKRYWFLVKVAVTDLAASIVTMQEPVPVQTPPDQPAKVEVASEEAVRVTTVPALKLTAQVEPQEIPAGLEETEPVPVPDRDTVIV
jgi:hypothetical protein